MRERNLPLKDYLNTKSWLEYVEECLRHYSNHLNENGTYNPVTRVDEEGFYYCTYPNAGLFDDHDRMEYIGPLHPENFLEEFVPFDQIKIKIRDRSRSRNKIVKKIVKMTGENDKDTIDVLAKTTIKQEGTETKLDDTGEIIKQLLKQKQGVKGVKLKAESP